MGSGAPTGHGVGMDSASLAAGRSQWWIVTLDGERIRQARRRARLSQAQLALAAGVGLATVGSLERQARPRCHFTTRARVAAALGAHPQAITAVTAHPPEPAGANGTAGSGPAAGHAASRAFAGQAEQVGAARAFVRRALAGFPTADDAALLCSELAANAVRHSASGCPGGQFTVRVTVQAGEWAWLEVADQGGPWTFPQRRGEGGRGLIIVDELADGWDIRGDESGRAVCAWLRWPG
jgi:serine/threonine-protein kinase RsbW